MKKLNLAKIRPLIQMAIAEDLGQGDVTSDLLFKKGAVARANIISREEIVVCGMDVAAEILKCYDEKLKLKVLINDGEPAHVASRLATIEGPLRSMLSAERVMLNFIRRRANTCGPSRARKQESTIRARQCRAGVSSKSMPSAAEAGTITGSDSMTAF
ncbi:MAG: beta/alpha barrel domain-containing protein [Planctomycetota bacterium]